MKFFRSDVVLVICLIVVVVSLAWFIYEAYIANRNKFLRYENHTKILEVISKKHQPSYTTYELMAISTKKATITTKTPVFHDEEFNIYLLYKGEDYHINDKNMFYALEVGNMVNVIVHEGFDQKGKLKNTFLTFTTNKS